MIFEDYILFIQLLQVTLGYRQALHRFPTAEEWRQLFQNAKDQTVVGVCFMGVKRMKDQGAYIPNDVYFEWLSIATMIQQRNEQMNHWTGVLCRKIEKDGFFCCVLKGQALARLYDDNLSLFRQSGDIDVWMLVDHKAVVGWGQRNGGIKYYDYHHAHFLGFHDAVVELHYRPTLSRNLWRNVRLQRWFKQEGAKLIDYDFKDSGFPVPNETFNLILVINHNFWHLLYEGVGMRQMMDLYFVLQSQNENYRIKNEEFASLIKHFGLMKFSTALMWVMKEAFGLPEEKMVCEPDEKSGLFLLHEIMLAGNFGHSDNRLKKNRYSNRVKLMYDWMKHIWRLFSFYPVDVLWSPVGVLYISFWRRWHYLFDRIDYYRK